MGRKGEDWGKGRAGSKRKWQRRRKKGKKKGEKGRGRQGSFTNFSVLETCRLRRRPPAGD